MCLLIALVAVIAAYLHGRATGARLERQRLAMDAVQDDTGTFRRK